MKKDEHTVSGVDAHISNALASICEALAAGVTEDVLIETVCKYLTGIEEYDTQILRYFRRMLHLTHLEPRGNP